MCTRLVGGECVYLNRRVAWVLGILRCSIKLLLLNKLGLYSKTLTVYSLNLWKANILQIRISCLPFFLHDPLMPWEAYFMVGISWLKVFINWFEMVFLFMFGQILGLEMDKCVDRWLKTQSLTLISEWVILLIMKEEIG